MWSGMTGSGGRWSTGERFGGYEGGKHTNWMQRPKEFPANTQLEDSDDDEEESTMGKMPPNSDDEE